MNLLEETEFKPPKEYFGLPRWAGVAGFFGGFALVGLCAWFLYAGALGAGRAAGKGTAYLGIGGVIVLAMTFRVRGVRFLPEGLEVWNFYFWLLGSTRTIPPVDLKSFVLDNKKNNFIVRAVCEGEEIEFPIQWPAMKDAQAVIDFGTRAYNTQAGIAIKDEKVLAEASRFAGATRWIVKAEAIDGWEVLEFLDEDGNSGGKVSSKARSFSSWKAEIYELNNGSFTTEPQYKVRLKSRLWGRDLAATDGNGRELDFIKAKPSFSGTEWKFSWKDLRGAVWSSIYSLNNSVFTIKLYRGLAENVKDPRYDSQTAPGAAAESIAVAHGSRNNFVVDVADESAWPWVRLTIAAAWLRCNPQ